MRAATVSHRVKVMIVGVGTGGLCLAQGLKADGIAVEVFERDYSLTDRLQGYRLGVNETGWRALRECLPKALFDKAGRKVRQSEPGRHLSGSPVEPPPELQARIRRANRCAREPHLVARHSARRPR